MLDAVFGMLDTFVDIIVPTMSTVSVEFDRISSLEEIEKSIERDNVVLETEKNRDNLGITKASNSLKDPELQEDVYKDIYRISKGKRATELSIAKLALDTEKLIKYAIYYMTNDNVFLLEFSDKDKTFINAICEFAGYGRIYPDQGSMDLSLLDIDSVEKLNIDYVVSLKDLAKRLKNTEFQELWKNKVKKNEKQLLLQGPVISTPNKNSFVDQDGIIHPIFFDPNSIIKPVDRQNGIPDYAYDKFESIFGPMLSEASYYYDIDDNGMYNIVLQRLLAMGAEDRYIIDQGPILGGTQISILGNYLATDGVTLETIFIPVEKYPEIAMKVLNNRWYRLEPDEIVMCFDNLFAEGIVYKNVDFSNTPYLDTMDETEKKLFGKNLKAACILSGKSVRLRIDKFYSASNFILVSDEACSSPLPFVSKDIEKGLTFTICMDRIIRTNPDGTSDEFNIVYEQH